MRKKVCRKEKKNVHKGGNNNPAHRVIARRSGYFFVEEAAKRACVNVTTIYRLINRGHLDTLEFGSSTLVSAQSLLAYYGQLREMHRRISAGVPPAALRRPACTY